MNPARIALAGALLALAGCATPFAAKVSRFQQLPAPTGQTFTVQAEDPQLQGGIEFNQYASIVTARMAELGYRPATSSRADLIVRMDYRVDTGRERVRSTGLGYGGFGGGFGYGGYGRGFGYGGFGRRWAYGFNDPFLFGGGGFNDVSSYTVFTSELALRIDGAGGRRVFEGTARAQSRSDELPRLVPNLIDAMFTDFPGNSGETVNITIAPEDGRAQVRR